MKQPGHWQPPKWLGRPQHTAGSQGMPNKELRESPGVHRHGEVRPKVRSLGRHQPPQSRRLREKLSRYEESWSSARRLKDHERGPPDVRFLPFRGASWLVANIDPTASVILFGVLPIKAGVNRQRNRGARDHDNADDDQCDRPAFSEIDPIAKFARVTATNKEGWLPGFPS